LTPQPPTRHQLLIGLTLSPILQALIALPVRADPWQPDPTTLVQPRWELAPPSPPHEPAATVDPATNPPPAPAKSLVWTAADDGSETTAGERRLTWVAVEPGDTDPATPFSHALAKIDSESTKLIPTQVGEGDRSPKTTAEALALARSLPPPASSFLPLLRIGLAVPTANQLESEGIQLTYGQITASGGQSVGTGNQNYYARLDVGLTQRLQLSGFYSVADDPLYARIISKAIQPANRWEVFGGAAQWKLGSGDNWSLAITGSLEQFLVGSGGSDFGRGTAGFRPSVSSNIFNDSLQRVETKNIVGSIGLPFSWNINRTLQLSFTPGASFLPATQGAGQGGAGTFFGSSITVSAGLSWRPTPQLNLFASGLLPLGPGTNSFDANLNFGRVPIYTAGLNYAINPRISLEGAITNGFGASPATALLALPSQEQLLYTGRFVYSIQAEDSPPVAMKRRQRSLATGGLTVNTALVPPEGSVQISGNIDSLGNLFGFVGYSASNDFQLQIWGGGVFNGIDPVTPLSKTFASDNGLNQRYGGKAVVFSQLRGAPFSGGGRITLGRNEDPASLQGYLFFEAMGTWEVTPWLALNSNPKLAWNGTSTPYGIGLSANVQLGRWFQFIPEVNLVASERTKSSGSNYTAALRWLPSDFAMVDVYVSNAAGLLDIGQLLGNSQVRLGGRLTLLF
jgi:hypothetical protein